MSPHRPHSRPIHRAIALAAAATLLAACSASLSPNQKTSSQPIPLTDVDSALAELDRAEGEIRLHVPGDRQDVGAAAGRPAAAGQTAPTTPSPAPEPAPAAAPPPPAESEATGAAAPATPPTFEASDPCFTACRALASMERAASHLCGLTGEEDPRCDGAKGRVRNATERVRAGCPSCAG